MQNHSIIPLGLCQCGCGQNTQIAKANNPQRSHIKGQPRRYLPGHNRRRYPMPEGAPPLCACGCGLPVQLNKNRWNQYVYQHQSNGQHNPMYKPFEERFWAKVKKTDNCWPWTGALNSKGYGSILFGEKTTLASRMSWQLANGPIPDGMSILHHCDNPLCVRPDHLFLGTQRDNIIDMVKKGRRYSKNHQPGVIKQNAKLTKDDVIAIRSQYIPLKVGIKTLARRFGVSHKTVSNILRRITWAHVP